MSSGSGSKALETVRHSTFHYPAPCAGLSELGLIEAIERESELPAALDLSDEAGAPFRCADQLAMSMALANFDDEEIDDHIAAVIEGSGAFARLVKGIFIAYCKKRKIGHQIVD